MLISGLALSAGCTGGVDANDGDAGETGDALAPTWHQDVAPLVTERCAGCHRSGGIAPFSMEAYETAMPWATLMAGAVEVGIMPPWGAAVTEECAPPHDLKNDPTLDDEEKAMLRAWADAGAPEGDPETAAELPEPPSLELADADRTLTIPTEVSVSGNDDAFYCFVVDAGLDSLTFLEATQINPGNSGIVHHVLVYATTSDEADTKAGADGYYECFGGVGIDDSDLIAAWAPGAQPNRTPANAPMALQPGTKLVINVHYHPTGAGVESDASTSVDLKFFDQGLPEYVSVLALIGNFSDAVSGGQGLLDGENDLGGTPQFRIPAGETAHVENMMWTVTPDLPDELRIWQVGTHMHYVGQDMMMRVERGETSTAAGDEDFCLLQTPRWDFNWQRGYVYDADLESVPRLRHGDEVHFRCTYDNSLGNGAVADALESQGLSEPTDVYLGEETLDEMCLGVFGIAVPLADVAP